MCSYLAMAAGILLVLPSAAMAGMPSVTITFSDWGAMRIQTLSFFILILLIAAAVARWLWNSLAADFPTMPRLTYLKSLAGVVLFGLILAVVLTMIAGSRELLTPGAWEKDGRLYKVASSNGKPAESPEISPVPTESREQLDQMFAALSDYAAKHEGKFPEKDTIIKMDQALWETPGANGLKYLYVSGLSSTDSDKILVYEPEFSSNSRLVLMTDGKVRSMNSAEIRQKLQQEEKP
jgi:hypothetical protein